MTSQLFTPKGIWNDGIVLIRVLSGIIIFKFGLELFSDEKMQGYYQWLTDLHFPWPLFMAKLGKAVELTGGALLVLGLFTRIAAVSLVITMSVIAFVMGSGDIFSGDSALLLLMIYLCFLFTGPGKWSLDHIFFKQRTDIKKK